jgi:hypothetical protein
MVQKTKSFKLLNLKSFYFNQIFRIHGTENNPIYDINLKIDNINKSKGYLFKNLK